MAKVIGTVKEAAGLIGVKKPSGELLPLHVGDSIEENDIVQSLRGDSGMVLELDGGRQLTLGGNEEVLIDQSVFAAVEEGTSLDVAELQAALLAGLDISELEETAAGEGGPGDSVQEAPVAERGDARGSVEASLRPTDSEAPSVLFDAPEAAAAPEGAEDINTAPVGVDDSAEASVSRYTVELGGDNGWEGVSIAAFVNGEPGEIWAGGNDEHGQGEGLYGKLGVVDIETQGNPKPAIDNQGGEEESLVFTFDGFLNYAEVELSSFNTSNSNSESSNDDAAVWAVYITGESDPIASGTFLGGPQDTLVIDTGDLVFDTLVIGTPADSENGHDDFFVESISGSGPVGIDSDLTVLESGTLFIPESDLIANDTDAEGDTLNIVDIDDSGTIGEVSIDADGNVTYDPSGRFDYLSPGEVATDTFEYTVSDGDLSDTATVTVSIVGTGSAADGVYNAETGVIDGGEGYDTIVIDNSEVPLDLSNLQNIEHIDLQGGGHTLSVSAEEIFNATDEDNFLQISGETGDAVTLNGFTLDSDTSASLDGYNAYVGSFSGEQITLHIDTDIDVDLIP